MIVGDDVGVECIKSNREDSGQGSAEFFGPQEEHDTKYYRNKSGGDASKKENRISVVAGPCWTGAVHKHVADGPLFVVAILPFRRLERKGESEGKKHESSEVFEEGWVFWVESHIAIAHIAVGGRNVCLFVIRHGFLARD